MQPNFKYQAKDCEQILPRDFNFEFPEDLDPIWAPENPVRSHLFNGFSLTMPYLEPFLIRSQRRAKEHISDPNLLEDIQGFCHQEANHFKCHRRFNEVVKANGYPELEKIENHMTKAYESLERKSLTTQLAYAAGFESMTCGFTHWFINDRVRLFGGNDPAVSTFWVVHMIEEIEHKTVAFDTFMAYSGKQFARSLGVIHGSFHVLGLGIWAMFVCLKKDGHLSKPKTWWQITRELGRLTAAVGPFLFRALLPGFNPRNEDDHQWAQDWVEGYNFLPAGDLIPLMDTNDPEMPVPFREERRV